MPGKRLTGECKDLVVKLLNYFKQERDNKGPLLPVTAVYERVSDALGLSLSTLTRITQETRRTDINQNPGTFVTKYRQRKKPKTEDAGETKKMEIRNVIYNMYSEKKHLTLKSLKEELARKQLMDLSVMSLSRLLHHIGFKYKKEDGRRALMERPNIALRRAEFLRKYKANQNCNFRRQVVFLDETWIFAKGNPKRSWQDESIKSVRKPEGYEGKRFIVLHAGHQGGFVNNASLVFSSSSKLADYHGDMNGDIFMKWIREKLVPNLEEPSLIVMDNASYHTMLLEKLPKASWTKTALIQWLRDKNIHVEPNLFKAELLAIAKEHAQTEKYVVDEYLREHGHDVLRLPPYHCQFNAIEMIWAQAKQFYDKHIGEEGYGDDKVLSMWQKSLEICSPERWASVVEHTKALIDSWYTREHILENVPEIIIAVGHDSSSDSNITDSDNEF